MDLWTVSILVLCLVFIVGGAWLVFSGLKRLLAKGADKRKSSWMKLLIGLVLILIPLSFFYASMLSMRNFIWSCYKNNNSGPIENYNETDLARYMSPEWMWEVEDFIANTIRFTREGDLIAHTKLVSRTKPNPVRIWRVLPNRELEPALAEAFLGSLGDEPSPNNPDNVFRFTLTDVSQDRVCVYVEQLYNMGLSKGSRGGYGAVWLILRKGGKWIKEDEAPVFLAD